MNIKSKAKAFIKEYGLNSSTVISFEELQKVAVKLGYKVYSPYGLDDLVLIELNVVEVYQANSAFCFADDDVKYIFIHPDLPNEIAASLMLHELAHIYLGHLKNSAMVVDSNEAEAKLFASCVLKTIFDKRALFTALNGILCALTAVMLAVSALNSQHQEPIAEVDTTTISAITSVANTETSVEQGESSEIVVITKSGKKYHKPDCYHVVGSDVAELTIAEAEDAGYEPCKDCFPQSNE